MRNLSLFGLLGTMIVGCGGGEETQPAPKSPETTAMTSPTQTAVDMKHETPAPAKKTFAEARDGNLKMLTECVNTHDAKKCSATMTDDASFTMVGMPEMHTKAEIEKAHEMWFAMAPDMKMSIAHSWCNEKEMSCVVHFSWAGTDTKGLMPGAKPTNKPVGADNLSFVWMNADGQVKKVVNYTNMMAPMVQAGLAMPGVPAAMNAAFKKMTPPVPQLAATPEHFMTAGGETETKNMEAVKTMFTAFETHKAADLLANTTDDVEHWGSDMDKTVKGKADNKKMIDGMFMSMPDAHSVATNMWAAGDFVVSEETFTGTMKKPFMGMPANNKPMTFHSGWVYMLKGGKIAKLWSFSNPMEGMPAPTAPAAKAEAKADAKATTPAAKGETKAPEKAVLPKK